MNHFRFASCGDRTLWFDTTRTLEHINTLALVGYQLTQTKPRNCKLMCNDNAYLPVPQTNVNPSLSIGRSDQEAIDVRR